MITAKRTTVGFFIAAAGAGAIVVGAGQADAAPQVCSGLPGQTTQQSDCSAQSSPDGLSLAVADNGGVARSTATNLAGPAAIALGPGASVHMTGIRPGLAIGIAGPDASVVIDGKNAPVCTGPGFAFGGDFQTLKGCRH
ncbi:DUF6764 family protein [Gordonia sp. NB41Y]|uniref:DUF6764 family protein n=1 Tax=Gordonia sp. NB41Y TaxID=875808 RepID=UPI0002BF1773|nr:DUF6764 family protein [Gordonia sp. NB41Y]EMP15207.1 hypothetical protein ISGA_185 [Gordonia sp. NB41Y]WLP89932.1 hypothetical protein Q9K23_20715 [Gordonia sp. NB41Y]